MAKHQLRIQKACFEDEGPFIFDTSTKADLRWFHDNPGRKYHARFITLPELDLHRGDFTVMLVRYERPHLCYVPIPFNFEQVSPGERDEALTHFLDKDEFVEEQLTKLAKEDADFAQLLAWKDQLEDGATKTITA